MRSIRSCLEELGIPGCFSASAPRLRSVVTLGPPNQISAVEGVATQLRSAIHRGDYASGDRLPAERELATMFGVSRITLREAIRILTEEGYLSARRGSKGGTFVTELTEPYQRWMDSMREDYSNLEDLLEFRIAVERRAAKLAVQRATAEDLAALEEAMTAMDRAESRQDYRRADNLFHGAVASASRSPRLIEAISDARGHLFTNTDLIVYRELVEETQSQHRMILEAIVRRDTEAVAAAVETHIQATRVGLHHLLFDATDN